jgi:hypothetical protein
MTTVLIPVPQNGHTPHDPMIDAVVAENRTPQGRVRARESDSIDRDRA